LNVEAIGNIRAAYQAQQLQKIHEENLLLASLGTLLATLTLPPKPLLAEAPSKVKTADPARPAAAPNTPPAAPAPTPQAQPPLPVPAASTTLRVGKPFPVLPAAQEQAFIQSRYDAKGRSWKVLEFQPLQYQTSSTQTRTLQSAVEAEGAARWWILVSVPAQEDRQAREAFWRMTSVREKLIAAGVKPESIAMRTLVQDGVNFSNGRRVFIDAQPTVPTHSN
jgi:hypothetical protein